MDKDTSAELIPLKVLIERVLNGIGSIELQYIAAFIFLAIVTFFIVTKPKVIGTPSWKGLVVGVIICISTLSILYTFYIKDIISVALIELVAAVGIAIVVGLTLYFTLMVTLRRSENKVKISRIIYGILILFLLDGFLITVIIETAGNFYLYIGAIFLGVAVSLAIYHWKGLKYVASNPIESGDTHDVDWDSPPKL